MQIPADADDPRLKVRPPIEVERLEDLQEDVLRQVLGLVVLADELVRDVEHLPPVLPDDRFPGHLIAPEALLDQRIGRDRGWGAAESTDIWPRLTRNLVSILAGGDVHQLQK